MSNSELAYPAEHVQKLLQCSVCLDRFKQPKLLPCQHTFCLRPCLEGLVNRLTRMLRCPECRADHIVPRGGPSHFPNNLTIIGFLELPRMAGERANASVEERSRSVVQREAGEDTQRGANATTGPAQRRVVAAGVVGDGEEGAGGVACCSACHTEGRLVRCSHCNQQLCELCKRAHMDLVRSDVNRLVNQVRRSLPHITEQINIIGRRGALLQNRCESLQGEVFETVDKHIRELKSRERMLKDDIDAFLLGELRGLRMHQENLEVELASMASFCDSAESSLSRAHNIPDGDLVEIKQQCVENMETLRDYENGTLRLPMPRNIQLSTESQFLTSTITSFGDLIVTSGTTALQRVDDGESSRPRRGAQDRRATLRPPETSAADYAVPVLSSRSVPESPPVTRRRLSPSRNARSAVEVNFNDDENFYSEETEAAPTTQTQRRPRRQHNSDTRVAGVMGGTGEPSFSRHQINRMRRHRSFGSSLPSNELPDHTESSPERGPPRRCHRARRRAFATTQGTTEESEQAGTGMAQSLAFHPPHPARTSVRFDVALDTPEPAAGADAAGGELPAYMSADSSPSMYVNTPRNKYNQKGQAVVRFGERGGAERQFTWPRGIAVSPLDDHIFVSDSSNHRVQVFDNVGVFLRTFGRYGQGEGEFDCLAGITVNGLGQVIITDRYNHRVQIFDRNGNFQRSFGSEGSNDGELNYPWGVACDNMGFIYVCDKENHRIQVFQANGVFVRKFGRVGNGAGQFDNPHYIAVSPDNKVYVSDSSNHRIQIFSIYGDFLSSFGISGTLRGQMKFPRGIAIDNQGFVVVADSGNNRVQIFRADGRYFSMFGTWGSENGQFKGIEGLAILANGNIAVSDRENHRIQIF